MLVKCSWCQKTFNSERYGRQFCPHCGAELDLPLPGASEAVPEPRMVQPGEGAGQQQPVEGPEVVGGGQPGAPRFDPWAQPGEPGAHPGSGPRQQAPSAPQWGAPPEQPGPGTPQWGGGALPPGGGHPPGGALPPGGGGGGGWGGGGWEPPEAPQEEESPWERRSELGAWNALVETWKQASLDPKRFFARLKTTDIGEAFLYGWILATLGSFLGGLWAVPLTLMTEGEPLAAWGQVAVSPIFSAIGLFLGAGLIHLGCLVFGCANRGFDATFRTVAYAQGPQLLNVVPFVGGLAATVWIAVITIQGLAAMQRTTTGKATAAVLAPGLVLLLCCGCAAAVGLMGIFSAMGGSMGGSF
ncbi:YIP1 family protein [Vulgatibacter sp.]|uniref:YIP1 family protein n=1 Tax=Vulgatibacter sp. TaxID=1971226 RepID=UPI003566A37D